MSDYKRITMREFAGVTGDNIYNRLAELENKIEAGTFVDRDEYLDRLMAAKDTSGMTDKEIKFFTKHDVEVCKEVVKECLQVLRDMRLVCLYGYYASGWNECIDIAIERLAEKYCINEEVE